MRPLLQTLLGLLFCSPNGLCQVVPTDPALLQIRSELQALVQDSVIPSMAVSVVKDGSVLWQEAIGYANVANKFAATTQHAYPLGSVSKSVTGTAVMTLVQDGALELQQDIRPLIQPIQLRDFKGETPPILLWQLLSMTGGINHGYGVFYSDENLPLDPDRRTRFFEETTILAFPPGTVFEYTNRAFYLAEHIMERLSQKSFQKVLEEQLLRPLGMTNTWAYAHQSPDKSTFVKTYSSQGLNEINKNISYPSGGSGIWASLDDMTQYARFHLGDLKQPQVLDSLHLHQLHHFRQEPADLFGLGWFNFGNTLYSNGNVSGGNAAILIDKQHQLGIVCLLNKTSNDGLADQFVGKIREIFDPGPHSGYEAWQRIYGTPYSPRYSLEGTWTGTLKQPLTSKSIPIALQFDDTYTIKLQLGQQSLEVRSPTYNLFSELKGSIRTALPGISDEETNAGFKLNRTGNTLQGYLQYNDFREHRFYRLPLYMNLHKEGSKAGG